MTGYVFRRSTLALSAGVMCALASPAAAGAARLEAAAPAMLPTGETARPPAASASGDQQGDVPRRPALGDAGPVYVDHGRPPLPLKVSTRRLASAFGWRDDPFGAGRRFHAGVDLPGQPGSAIRAVRAGVVVHAGRAGGYGTLVTIDHGDGLRTRYGHLERADVAVGQKVAAGTIIGVMGSTGRSTGPHLHYEVRRHGRAIDPRQAWADPGIAEPDTPPAISRAIDVPSAAWVMPDQSGELPRAIVRAAADRARSSADRRHGPSPNIARPLATPGNSVSAEVL